MILDKGGGGGENGKIFSNLRQTAPKQNTRILAYFTRLLGFCCGLHTKPKNMSNLSKINEYTGKLC